MLIILMLQGDSIFPVHNTAVISDGDQNIDSVSEEISFDDLIIHVRITDDDFDLVPFGQDQISTGSHGLVQIMMTSGSDTLLLATASGIAPNNGVITTGQM